ncbi:MAG: endolytic transglycosylase MltG [Merdibacter sp.]
MSIHELITLASIVQYEASTAEDMKTIAGVFYNRLQEGMPLQSTVTVCYALYDDLDRSDSESWRACEASTDIDSPYNTYLNERAADRSDRQPGRTGHRGRAAPG